MSDNNQNNEVIKTVKYGILGTVFSRFMIILILLAIQALYLFGAFVYFGQYISVALGGTSMLSIIMTVYLLSADINPTAKLTWVVLAMVVPVFTVPLYFFIQADFGFNAIKRHQQVIGQQTLPLVENAGCSLDEIKEESIELYNMASYVKNSTGLPVYSSVNCTYFPQGEDKFRQLKKELEKAEKFIFLEYFIIEDGLMWGEILKILIEKVRQGVEVRVMYDGTCAFFKLPYAYPKKLIAYGIDCKMYGPIRPFITTHYNNRDHRKILVIDGHTAFTGGINLADEYINHVEKHGHWKDTAIMLKGVATKSFTLMFLQMWNSGNPRSSEDYAKYVNVETPDFPEESGYVIPFSDSPLDGENTGEMVYLDIINRAEKYVHIMSPYLILDGEMETALRLAAKKGVDVKLILPHIPDKKFAFALQKSHYKALVGSGVKIYEYTPGFIHAKVFVSDSVKAVVGSINLDYRSFYHHFECAAYLYNASVIKDIEADVEQTLKKSSLITADYVRKEKLLLRLYGRLLKIFAPLM